MCQFLNENHNQNTWYSLEILLFVYCKHDTQLFTVQILFNMRIISVRTRLVNGPLLHCVHTYYTLSIEFVCKLIERSNKSGLEFFSLLVATHHFIDDVTICRCQTYVTIRNISWKYKRISTIVVACFFLLAEQIE